MKILEFGTTGSSSSGIWITSNMTGPEEIMIMRRPRLTLTRIIELLTLGEMTERIGLLTLGRMMRRLKLLTLDGIGRLMVGGNLLLGKLVVKA